VSQQEQKTAAQELSIIPPKGEEPRRFDAAKELAEINGLDTRSFLTTVKAMNTKPATQYSRGCQPTDADVMVMLLIAREFKLNPLASPPDLQILDFGAGPQSYARVDAYKKFVHAARASGLLEWASYGEDWRPDPKVEPSKAELKRAGVVKFKLRGGPEQEKVVWFDEWVMSKNPNWQTRGSQMLSHRTWKEFCRDYLGWHVYDTDDAERTRSEEPRQVEASVRDAAPSARAEPAIPIRTVSRVPVAPAPPDLEEQGNPGPGGETAASTSREVVASSESPAAPASPVPPAPEARPFDEAESLRLDAMAAAEAEKPRTGLFEP